MVRRDSARRQGNQRLRTVHALPSGSVTWERLAMPRLSLLRQIEMVMRA
jgi:hypothetical protein